MPLPITDVVTSLQTGLIDGVYTSPMGCIALQWFTRVSYMTDLPVTHANGRVVVTKKVFDTLAPSAQAIVKESAKKYFAQLNEATGKEGTASLATSQAEGGRADGARGGGSGRLRRGGQDRSREAGRQLYTREVLDQTLQASPSAAGKGGSKP